jgi:hypothetical protein
VAGEAADEGRRVNRVDNIDAIALNALVAWQVADPTARSFRIEPHIDGPTVEWAVLVKSSRWRAPRPGEVEERGMWHVGGTLQQAISNALDSVFRHKGAA